MLHCSPTIAFASWTPSSKSVPLGQQEFKTTQLPVLHSSLDGLKVFTDDGEDSRRLTLPSYKWRLVISYDGTRFSGWQYQQSTPTVQCIVEEALTRITKLERDHLCVVGASRTDAGVHAWGQVAHFTTPFNYDSLESIHRALNGFLPPDIRIREVRSVLPEFHARFSVKSKIYRYMIYNDTVMDPFHRRYVYHSAYKLNPAAMMDAAKHFVGRHDFSAFANTSRNDRMLNPVKNIFRVDVNEMGPLIQLEVEGSGFLYRQVRNMPHNFGFESTTGVVVLLLHEVLQGLSPQSPSLMESCQLYGSPRWQSAMNHEVWKVALLLQVGREAVPSDIVLNILASRDRKELAKYALSVPPHGLTLFSVDYNEDHLKFPSGRPATSLGRHHTISKCKLPFW